MSGHRIEIGIVVGRRVLNSAWGNHAWYAHAVLPAAPTLAPGTPLGHALFYEGSFEVALHAGATAYYRDNLQSERPSLWIVLTPVDDACRVIAVTADPYEGEALTEAIGSTVDAVGMPEMVQAEIAAFIAAFHVDRPFFKRARDRADPEVGRGRSGGKCG